MYPSDIAEKITQQLFGVTVRFVVVVDDSEVEMMRASHPVRKGLFEAIDKVWNKASKCETTGEIRTAVLAACESGTKGITWCGSREEAVGVLTRIYERLMADGKHDAYDHGNLVDEVAFVRIWLD